MESEFLKWIDDLKTTAQNDFGYDINNDYFSEYMHPLWAEYYEAGRDVRSAIIEVLEE